MLHYSMIYKKLSSGSEYCTVLGKSEAQHGYYDYFVYIDKDKGNSYCTR